MGRTANKCICKGNWQQLVQDNSLYIGRDYVDNDGCVYKFFGLVHDPDDYYYGMYDRDGRLHLLSCVGNLESHGYKLRKGTL